MKNISLTLARFFVSGNVFWLLVFLLTRMALFSSALLQGSHLTASSSAILGQGFVFDLAFLVYFDTAMLLVLLPLLFISSRRVGGVVIYVAGLLLAYIALFTACAEWFFWDEFRARFNFIAVDYLVYSDEVIHNILESYPVYPLLGLIAVMAFAVNHVFLARFSLSHFRAGKIVSEQQKQSRFPVGALSLLLLLFCLSGLQGLFLSSSWLERLGSNPNDRELAGNGPYQFFAAFRNNELDYTQFYPVLDQEQLATDLPHLVGTRQGQRVGGVSDALDITRFIDNPGHEKKLNVILVTIESLSARYLGVFGNTEGLTPNLDRLAGESLFFDRFYATGTRTTRGLESITLSIPPTPGRSVVKRPGQESGFRSLGFVLGEQGYDATFLYGGRSYFDNMGNFFQGNGYRVIDQNDMPAGQAVFTNAWGMSDEDLYGMVLQQADQSAGRAQPFFLQVMTTSNHRPYTYPEGRIDIPSGVGRDGAVKYTDYAIGQFLQQARQHDWFEDTVFVFVADHCAGSDGREDLPLDRYHIPLFIYSPAHLPAQTRHELASQPDIAPSLMALLDLDYVSSFFGFNLLSPLSSPHPVFIANYQHLGLFDGEQMAILSPGNRARLRSYDQGMTLDEIDSRDAPLVRDAISLYQGAAYILENRLDNQIVYQPPSLPSQQSHVFNEPGQQIEPGLMLTESREPVGEGKTL